MPQTISIRGKKASATIFCSNIFINNKRQTIFLTGYGPSQEVRAFAQLLESGEATLEAADTTFRNITSIGTLRIIPKFDNGYSGIYIVPAETSYVVGESEEACFGIYSRILDQHHFVHAEWYKEMFALAEVILPTIGSMKCYRIVTGVENEVQQRLKYGGFKFPESTATIMLEAEQKNDNV